MKYIVNIQVSCVMEVEGIDADSFEDAAVKAEKLGWTEVFKGAVSDGKMHAISVSTGEWYLEDK